MDRSQDPPLSVSVSRPQRRQHLRRLVHAALASADAGCLIERALAGPAAEAAEGRAAVIAAGKAAAPMAAAFGRAAAGRVSRGLVIGTHAAEPLPAGLAWIRAGHPVPDRESERAGREALALAAALGPQERLVVLLSGGASALLAVPTPGLTLEDKQEATRALLLGGADIARINCVRRHLSAIKGGRLAAATRARLVTLALSDVLGPVADDPCVIGSGPTAGDSTTFGDALEAVAALPPGAAFPPRARALLERGARGELEDTPAPGDERLAGASYVLIGNRHDAVAGARREAERLGYQVVVHEAPVIGEAREAAIRHAAVLQQLASALDRPVCVLSTGETTVTVRGDGIGGRNLEFALSLATALEGRVEVFAAASVGTDGVDGPTDAAGALVDETTLARARRAGLPAPAEALLRNDTLRFFDPLGDLVRTGPTGTNVGDLQIVLLGGA